MDLALLPADDSDPAESDIDLNALDALSDACSNAIDTCFEKHKYTRGDRFECRVVSVYDPSKFYIIPKHIELEAFQTYLFKSYYMKTKQYRLPEDKIRINMYCVVYSDFAYYRGMIVGLPVMHSHGDFVQVYYLDYGSVGVVEFNNLYYMAEELYKVPQFAVRASLALMSPIDGRLWTSQAVNSFSTQISSKVLEALVIYSELNSKVVGVHLCECDENGPIAPMIHELLIEQKHAKYLWDEVPADCKLVDCFYEPKTKFGFMFPSHSVIETGKVPLVRSDAEYLENVAPLLVHEGPYFKMKAIGKQ